MLSLCRQRRTHFPAPSRTGNGDHPAFTLLQHAPTKSGLRLTPLLGYWIGERIGLGRRNYDDVMPTHPFAFEGDDEQDGIVSFPQPVAIDQIALVPAKPVVSLSVSGFRAGLCNFAFHVTYSTDSTEGIVQSVELRRPRSEEAGLHLWITREPTGSDLELSVPEWAMQETSNEFTNLEVSALYPEPGERLTLHCCWPEKGIRVTSTELDTSAILAAAEVCRRTAVPVPEPLKVAEPIGYGPFPPPMTLLQPLAISRALHDADGILAHLTRFEVCSAGVQLVLRIMLDPNRLQPELVGDERLGQELDFYGKYGRVGRCVLTARFEGPVGSTGPLNLEHAGGGLHWNSELGVQCEANFIIQPLPPDEAKLVFELSWPNASLDKCTTVIPSGWLNPEQDRK